ncbi:MAG: peptidoglycan editing factor PgeF [Pseudomonadota bacterium]
MARDALPAVEAPSLSPLPGIVHGFFGRTGGVSTGIYASLNAGAGSDDAPDAVRENRSRIAAHFGLPDASQLVSCHQHHSADALLINDVFKTRPKGDAMVTRQAGIALAILTADCVPILFADAETHTIGAAHAGWKGAISGICAATLDAMEALGAARARIQAAIGPAIGQASYEVGPEFVERFLIDAPANEQFFKAGAGDRHHFDIQGYVRAQLEHEGLRQVDVIAHDTCAMEDTYFSNRRRTHRGEADYGRNASVILLHAEGL